MWSVPGIGALGEELTVATVVSVEADGGAAGDGTPARLPVFVYGTLRPGRVNWPVAEPWCERTAPGRAAPEDQCGTVR